MRNPLAASRLTWLAYTLIGSGTFALAGAAYALRGQSAEAWTAVAAWLALVVYIVTGVLIWRQVKEAKALREDQARPFLLLDFEWDEGSVQFVLRNIGKTAAYEVTFAFIESPVASFDHGFRTSQLEDLAMIAPGRELRFDFDVFANRLAKKLPTAFTYTAHYKTASGRAVKDGPFTIDMRILDGARVPSKGLHQIATGIERLASASRQQGIRTSTSPWKHGE